MLPRLLSAILLASCIVSPVEAEKLRHGRGTYYLHVPPNVENPSMLVWLHPAAGGAKPEFDFWRKQSPAFGDGGNSILLAPQAIEGAWGLRPDEAFIKAVVKKVMNKYGVDPEKVVLGGHSAGATFTYELGLRNQELFHALFPNAGRFTGRKVSPPDPDGSPLIYLFHSQDDTVIPFSEAERARDMLRTAGYPVSFYSDNVQHNIGGMTLALFAAIDRLIQQVEPRVVRIFGGLEGIKVLAEPGSFECFKLAKASVAGDPMASPVVEDNMTGEPIPVAGSSAARLLSALVDAKAYSPGPITASGTGSDPATNGVLEAFRIAGPQETLEVVFGSGGEWMKVYLGGHQVGTATLDAGAQSELYELARGLLPAG